MICLYRVQTTI